jgi:hypothetical protein
LRWILVPLLALAASAQTAKTAAPPFTSAPSIEDRNLYYTFFTIQLTVYNNNQSAKAASPSTGTQIDAQTAATLQITAAELPTFFNVIQQANQSYAQIPVLRQAYPSSPNARPLTPAQLDGVDDFRRLYTTVRSVQLLWQQLSPTSWAGLHHYILNDFKNSLPAQKQ